MKNGSQFNYTQNLHIQTICTQGETSNKLKMYEYVYQFTLNLCSLSLSL